MPEKPDAPRHLRPLAWALLAALGLHLALLLLPAAGPGPSAPVPAAGEGLVTVRLAAPAAPPAGPVGVHRRLAANPAVPARTPASGEPGATEAATALPAAAPADAGGDLPPAAAAPGDWQPPVRLDDRRPPYPARSRRLGEQGTVLLRLSVDEAGRVTAGTVLQGSGHAALDEAARAAALGWRFAPARRDGAPQAAAADVEVSFVLGNGTAR